MASGRGLGHVSVAIDAARADFGALSTFERLVEADDHRALRCECADQQHQQLASDGAAAPTVSVQDAMEVGEMRIAIQPGDPQDGSDRPTSGRKDRPGDQDKDIPPSRRRKACSERLHPVRQLLRRSAS